MPFRCPVCDNEEYNEDDGVFFCTECGTQSQDYIVQEVNETTFLETSTARHEVVTAKADGGKEKPKISFGRPWTIYEAYQIIILAQADSLIALGVNKDLKDVVYTLWANYLSKLGIAFCSKERLVPEIVDRYKVARTREIYRGDMENPLNMKKQPIQKSSRGKGVKRKRASLTQEGNEATNHEQELAENEEHEKPKEKAKYAFAKADPSLTVFMDEGRLSESAGEYSRSYMCALRSSQWMNIDKTIAFCFIGLVLTDPNILPCDVVRWVYEGSVPYLSTSHLLPADMMLSGHDTQLFKVHSFSPDSLLLHANRLTSFLQLKDLPLLDLNVLAARLIRELCLPNEFTLFVQRLIKKIPFTWTYCKTAYRRCEELVLGYIILAMKILFGLNDASENFISEYSQRLQRVMQSTPPLFAWSEWRHLLEEKQCQQFDAYRELTSDISSTNLKHLDKLLGCYAKSNRHKSRVTATELLSRTGRPVQQFDPEFRNVLVKPITSATANMDQTKEDKSQNVHGKLTEKIAVLKESTVCHMVDPLAFKKKIKNCDKNTRHQCEELLSHISTLKPSLVQYKYPSDEHELVSSRHESYLWLLETASAAFCCNSLSVEKIVVRLTQYLVSLSEGNLPQGASCSKQGILSCKGYACANNVG